jgi:putative membrane protein
MILPFSWHHLNHWDHWRHSDDSVGWRRRLLSRKRATDVLLAAGALGLFRPGLLITFIATQSFIGTYDMEYFSDHMVQHLLLIMVAAPLFALSAPLDLAYESGTTRMRRFLDGPLHGRSPTRSSPSRCISSSFPVTHLTGFMNLMMTHMWIHHLEQIGFLVVGYLFFRAAFGLERGFTLHPGLRLVFVMAAVPVDTFTGLVLSMSSRVPFSNYAAMAPTGLDGGVRLSNIKLGGAIMWIGGDALMLLALHPHRDHVGEVGDGAHAELDAILDAQGI